MMMSTPSNQRAPVSAPPDRPFPRSNREVREIAGWSLARVAVFADVGPVLARIYEISPAEVKDLSKRRSLERVYDALRDLLK